MATRVLPGAYVSLNDLSQMPEGQTALTVGYVVKANRGPVNEATLVTSPTDFLTKFTLSGKPALNEDPTFWSVLKVLAQTNSMYVVRAANNPLYGGLVFKKGVDYGTITAVNKSQKKITVQGTTAPAAGTKIMINGTNVVDGYYTVVSATTSASLTNIVVSETIAADYTPMFTITAALSLSKQFTVSGSVPATVTAGSKITVRNATVAANNKEYTVVSVVATVGAESTAIIVNETVEDGSDGDLFIKVSDVYTAPAKALTTSISDPDAYEFDEDEDLFLITGIDQGAYNGQLSFEVLSAADNASELIYHVGADLGTGTACTFDTMQLKVKNANTNEVLETFLFSRDENAKTIDGTSLFIEDVLEASAYIKVVNNAELEGLPYSTVSAIQAGAGSDGSTVDSSTLVAALSVFADKTIPVSIIGNGCSAEAESTIFQQAMLEIASSTRKDCVAFLNSRQSDETATVASTRAQNIVDYKKGDLGSSSFYGTMYCPHVKSTDIYNNRQVKIGADAIAIAGWLSVINTLNYPYAYAGPQNGLVSGVTTQWKIGDASGEAELLNDASINYIAYDGKVGRYYMQCQNTLQVANSTMRNLGAVLNVLDIKEHMSTYLKEYLQLPITTSLRQDIINKVEDYLSPMTGVRFYNYAFQDITTDAEIANNELHYLLTLAPTAYAQRIYVVMNIVNASFDFSILQSL